MNTKRFFAFLLLATLMLPCHSEKKEQFTIVQMNAFGIKGGTGGKKYAARYKTKKTKRQQIESTINLLSKMGLVNKEKVKLATVNEKTQEFTTSFVFNTGIGINPAGSAPLHLYGDLRFKFYDDGMELIVENFSEEFFIVHYQPDVLNHDPGTKTWQQYDQYVTEAGKVSKANSGFGKVIGKIDKIQEITHISNRNGSIIKDAKNQVSSKLSEAESERKKILEDYRARVVEQEKLFKQMAAIGEGQWYTLEKYINAAEKCEYFIKYPKAANSFLTKYRSAQKNENLYDFSYKRWEKDIRYIFDGLIISIAEAIDGQIDGIAEDGMLKWERAGELVVPTDSKQRDKYIKKGKSFTDYESYSM